MTNTTPTAFEPLTAALLGQLEVGAGEHRVARFHVDVLREPGNLTPTAFRGSSLVSEDAERLAENKPFVGGNAFQVPLKALIEATNERDPVYLIDYLFWRDGAAWTYAFATQSVAVKERMDAARAPIDEALRLLMLAKQTDDWKSSTFERRGPAPLRFVSLDSKKKLTKHEITPEAQAMHDRYEQFYASEGLALTILSARVESKTPKRIVVDLHYGARR